MLQMVMYQLYGVYVQLRSDERPVVIKEINPDKTALLELEDHTSKLWDLTKFYEYSQRKKI